jgi:hypothetical protein
MGGLFLDYGKKVPINDKTDAVGGKEDEAASP